MARFGTIRHGQSMTTEFFHECFLSRHSVPPKFIGGNRDVFLPLRDAVLLQWGHQHSSVHIARFDRLVNTGERPNLKAAQLLVNAAVKDSLKHLRILQKDHEHKMIPLYRKETRRLKKWSDRRKDILENKIDEISSEHPRAKRYKKELEEMKDYINDREKIGRKHIFYLWIIQPLN